MNDHFGAVRSALAMPPSLSAFEALCKAVCLAHDADAARTVEEVMPYALEHLARWPDATRALPNGRVVPDTMRDHLDFYIEAEAAPYGLLYGEEPEDTIDLDAFDEGFGFEPRVVLHGPLVRLAKQLHIDAPYVDGDYEGDETEEAFAAKLMTFEDATHFTGLALHCTVNGSVGFGSLSFGALGTLAGLGAFDGFEWLDLSNHYLENSGIVTLSQMSHLRALVLRDVELDTAQLAALAQAPEMADLHTLDLGCRYKNSATLDLAALANPETCTWANMISLDLSNRRLTRNSVAALAGAEHLSTLESLDLTGCHVNQEDWRALAASAHLSDAVRAYAEGQLG